ncbi:MAG: FAD:protein FMN transferase [Kineosporiaceae bacterium]
MHPVNYRSTDWRALGTYVFLGVADGDRLDEARDLAEHLLGEVDRTCSRFREDSDLMRANQAAGEWVDVSPLLVEAVEAALDVAASTEGLVDPTLGKALVALGYDRDLDAVRERSGGGTPGPADLPPMPGRSGWREVRTDPAGRLKVPDGVALDLGATGKAFAADVISVALADQGIDCILSLGGDVAVGRSGDAVHPWPVSLSERPEGEVVETFTLTEGGVATSTTVHRTWTHQGRAVHHVLDPATGLPVQRTWRTVTVRAGTCLAANAASTASLVLGERADRWLTDRGFAARLVSQDGSVRTLGGWPDPPVEGQD